MFVAESHEYGCECRCRELDMGHSHGMWYCMRILVYSDGLPFYLHHCECKRADPMVSPTVAVSSVFSELLHHHAGGHVEWSS